MVLLQVQFHVHADHGACQEQHSLCTTRLYYYSCCLLYFIIGPKNFILAVLFLWLPLLLIIYFVCLPALASSCPSSSSSLSFVAVVGAHLPLWPQLLLSRLLVLEHYWCRQ